MLGIINFTANNEPCLLVHSKRASNQEIELLCPYTRISISAHIPAILAHIRLGKLNGHQTVSTISLLNFHVDDFADGDVIHIAVRRWRAIAYDNIRRG